MSYSEKEPDLLRYVIQKVHMTLSLTFPSHAGSEMVKVLAGEQRKTYIFHKTLLTSRCPYFEKCLTGYFSEGRNNEVVLGEENCEEFDHLFRWIYTGQLDLNIKLPFGGLYVLANRFCMEKFKSLIVDALINYLRDHDAPVDELSPLAEHHLPSSPPAILLMRQIAYELAAQHDSLYVERLRALCDALGDTEAMAEFFDMLADMFHRKAAGVLTNPADHPYWETHISYTS